MSGAESGYRLPFAASHVLTSERAVGFFPEFRLSVWYRLAQVSEVSTANETCSHAPMRRSQSHLCTGANLIPWPDSHFD
jgi:hypothetical protein